MATASAQLVAYVPLLFVAALFSLAIATYTWRNRTEPGATPLTGLLIGMAAWAGFYGLGLLTHDLGIRLVWLRLNWMGSGFVPVFWLLFALEYSGIMAWTNRWTVGALASVPTATVVLAWTSSMHDLLWSDPLVEDLGAVTILRYENGVWQLVFNIYSYLLIAVATALLVRMVVRHRDMYTDQAAALLLGSFMPAVGYLISALGFSAPGIDLTPLTFPVTGILFAFTIFRGNLFEALAPTAAVGQEAAVEAIQDAVVVTDEDDIAIECNPAAASVLGTDDLTGQAVGEIPALSAIDLDGTERAVEVDTPNNRTLEVRATPITDVHDSVVGHALVLRDITDRKTDRQRLQVTNRLLRHNLRNDMSIIIGNAQTIERATEDPQVRSLAERIVDAGESLTASGTKVRELEELIGGESERTTVDVARLTRVIVADLRDQYPDARIEHDVPKSADIVAIEGIDAAIREALVNAVEHTDEGERVVMTVENRETDVLVRVVDDGPGVPETEREVVERDEETALSHGSGTGLWLIKWLVERSGGTLDITVDEGTTVEMRFDRAVSDGD
ncbi:histidine kinase N-terminal 7TM domain-containing protein [Halovenus salina]|uniref:histidine kinase n=1 Tax=Halovenus salina TaxID=1510225 RepID=A0ABD5VZH0_9EURY|nr:histidine kinase N-terminal 7TM domain-containing protein [Halovenus salina]